MFYNWVELLAMLIWCLYAVCAAGFNVLLFFYVSFGLIKGKEFATN